MADQTKVDDLLRAADDIQKIRDSYPHIMKDLPKVDSQLGEAKRDCRDRYRQVSEGKPQAQPQAQTAKK